MAVHDALLPDGVADNYRRLVASGAVNDLAELAVNADRALGAHKVAAWARAEAATKRDAVPAGRRQRATAKG